MLNQENLLKDGWLRLPDFKLSESERSELLSEILSNEVAKIYTESTKAHDHFINMKGINTLLAPRLFKIANKMGYNVEPDDTYFITRVVNPDDPHEFFKAHFDSHLFTLVTPINIPNNKDGDKGNGELIVFPKIRNEPKSELLNVLQKIFFKSFANKKGINILSKRKKNLKFDFKDNIPILFLGRTTFHFNLPVINKTGQKRVTLLTHFYDPSPKFGVGSVLRKIRNR